MGFKTGNLPKVGDRVRIIGNSNNHKFKIGEEVTLHYDYYDGVYFNAFGFTASSVIKSSDFEVIEDEGHSDFKQLMAEKRELKTKIEELERSNDEKKCVISKLDKKINLLTTENKELKRFIKNIL